MRRVPFASTPSRLLLIALVTLTEGTAVYAWLRLYESSHEAWAWAVLVAGELLETTVVAGPLRRARGTIPIGDPFGVAPHRRRFARRFGAATFGELVIWVAWLQLAVHVDQLAAAGVLLVLMHLKHQLEAATVRDTGYFTGFWRVSVASASETAGAAGCLALIRDNRPVLAAAALAAGLLLEHRLLLYQLFRELEKRDISVPRPHRPPLPLVLRILDHLGKRMPSFWRLVQRIRPIEHALNRMAIDRLVGQVPPRPNPLSLLAPYSSWESLTDRTYTGRHLEPAVAGARCEPRVDTVAALFARERDMEPCPKSTVLFAAFAQWFVDGFLRTERDKPGQVRNPLRNESNHDVDLAQLYGFTAAATDALRQHEGGRLRSTCINGEEFPERLCHHGLRKRRFRALPLPLGFNTLGRAERDQLFAMGADVRSIQFAALNVLFLREHNRIARELQGSHRGWDDERLFRTARAILIVILIKIVVGEYINHITGFYFHFRFPPPGTFRKAEWFRQNWTAVEFDLLYRWHPLIPDVMRIGDRQVTVPGMLRANDVLTSSGLRAFMLAASEQRAGRIGLFNTNPHLVANAEVPSIQLGRLAELRSYNDYREFCRLPRLTSFNQFSTDERVGVRLHALYDRVDDVEFYVGLFAEEAGRYAMLPPLMTAMVSFDAFSQVLTNPLLSPRVYGPQTFTPTGMEIIDGTDTLATLIRRNVPFSRDDDYFSMTWREYRGP